MTRRYVHFSARDLEEAVLELHGLKTAEKADKFLRLVECPRCGRKNQPNNVRCSFCGYILDRRTADEIEQRRRGREEEIFRRLERLEEAVYSLLGGQAETPQPQGSSEP